MRVFSLFFAIFGIMLFISFYDSEVFSQNALIERKPQISIPDDQVDIAPVDGEGVQNEPISKIDRLFPSNQKRNEDNLKREFCINTACKKLSGAECALEYYCHNP